jgi:transposase
LERLAHPDGIPDLSDLERGAAGPRRQKTQELCRAVGGFFTAHHRFQLCLLLRSIRQLEGQLGEVLVRLEKQLISHQELRQRLKVVPGIRQVASAGILAEVGPSLAGFKSSNALSSWCRTH